MAICVFPYPVSRGIHALLHPAVRDEPRQAAQHGALIATRLIGGGLALVAFPAYLALMGPPTLVGAVVFAWLLTPLAVAFYLSRSGRLDAARIASSGSLAGLVALVAGATGGPASPLLVWMLAVPAEAALWGSRRLLGFAVGFAGAATAAVCLAALAGVLPPAPGFVQSAWALPLLGLVPAALYVVAVAAAQGAPMAGRPADEGGETSHRMMIEHGPDAVTRHRRNGNVTYASGGAGRCLGVPAGELHGCGLFNRVHVMDRPAYLKAIDLAAETGEAAAEIRLAAGASRTQDWLWIEMRCRALPDAEGDGPDVVSVLRDITALKAQEQAASQAIELAERRDLAKTRFLARVSHELRTPLNAIIGFSELLSESPEAGIEPGKEREYAGLIRDSGRHLLDLINDILDMSKLESGNFHVLPEPFDLAELIENCRQLLGPEAAAAGLSLENDLPVDLPPLMADRRACKQMLLNLLHNAVKFSNRNGRIVVGAYVEGEAACFYVADEGIGIARDDLARLGQPFVQLQSNYDRNYEGAGLGLSVVKGLVALHDGKLEIDSTPGVGTRVTVRLPLAPRMVPVSEEGVETQNAADSAAEPLRLTA